MYRKTEAIVDLDAILANYSLACDLAPQSKSIPVVKADAYGHGIVPVARVLQDVAPALAVAILDEAIVLREAGIDVPLLVLEGVNTVEAVQTAAANGLSLVVHHAEQVARLRESRLDAPIPVWLKVDTGMHRLGMPPGDVRAVVEQLDSASCEIDAICTHLACADEANNDATEKQLDVFTAAVAGLGLPLSIANSAGILAWPQSHADWNRPGYMLYGSSPMNADIDTAQGLRPAMSLRSELIAIREIEAGEAVGYGARWTATRKSRIGTAAIGYGDGYPRHAPNGTPTLVNGKVVPLVGTVSMDMITVDLTDHEDTNVGDSVELWGANVTVNDVAAAAGTIGYELLTGVTARVPRVY